MHNLKVITLKTSEIKPYWRNPRIHHNTEELKESITRYGFTSPLILDKDKVIIAGHARFKAALALELKEIPCIIREDLTPQQAKEFRLVDNKIASLSVLDQEKALQEMREIQNLEDFLYFFPEYDISDILLASQEQLEAITSGDIAERTDKLNNRFQDNSEAYQEGLIEVTCPHCLEQFQIDKLKIH